MFEKKTIRGFLKELASKKPVPGGGSAAALSGAMAAALVSMVAKVSGEENIAEKSEKFMGVLAGLVSRDAEAFERVIRERSSQESLKEATEIPMQTAEYACQVLKLAEVLLKSCSPIVITDLKVAIKLAETAAEGALLNAKANLNSISQIQARLH